MSDNKRYAMVIDTRTCVGCAACVIGCKTENAVADGFARDWIVTHTSGTFPDLKMDIRSERCHHCEDAPCVTSCPTGASHYGPGGSVQVNADKCTGCKACIASCPYDARFVDPRTGTCQEVCPTDSIYFGDLNDPKSEVSELLARRDNYTLRPEAGTRPRHYFLR